MPRLRNIALAAFLTLVLAGCGADFSPPAAPPAKPQRVVVLTNEGTEAVLALGLKPIGAATSWLGNPWYPHIAEAMEGVEPVGTESAILLERLVSLQPDLILANRQRHDEIRGQLESIAPTVFSRRLRGDWRLNFSLYAEALGRVEEGTKVLERYDARVRELAETLGESLAEEVSVVRFQAGRTRLYQLDSFSGVVLADLGFARPANQAVDAFSRTLGPESIPEMDGDRIFYLTYDEGNGDGRAAAERVLADPRWRRLAAVEAGRVHAVDDAIWNTAGGVLAAELMLEDIAAIYGVAGERSPDPPAR
ncbi:MAG: iron-siderophore ABC transporter substrate-binding protein [Acidobacteriota bacterium]